MSSTRLDPLPGLADHLARWVEDGVVSASQVPLILEEEARLQAQEPARSPLVTEALGYVGGVLVLVASVLLAAQFWSDLAIGVRLGLVGGAAALLLGVGAAMPARPGTTGERLRSVAWLLSTGALAFSLGLLAYDVFDWRDEDVVLTVTAGSATYAGILWVRSRLPLQQVALFSLSAASAAALLGKVGPSGQTWESLPALGVLSVGATWLLLGLTDRLAPRRLAVMVGAIGTVLGAAMLQVTDWGRVGALLTVGALVALALRLGQLGLLAIGTVGMLLVLPGVLTHWFPGAVAAPVVLLVCGSLFVLLALRSTRRREQSGTPSPRK